MLHCWGCDLRSHRRRSLGPANVNIARPLLGADPRAVIPSGCAGRVSRSNAIPGRSSRSRCTRAQGGSGRRPRRSAVHWRRRAGRIERGLEVHVRIGPRETGGRCTWGLGRSRAPGTGSPCDCAGVASPRPGTPGAMMSRPLSSSSRGASAASLANSSRPSTDSPVAGARPPPAAQTPPPPPRPPPLSYFALGTKFSVPSNVRLVCPAC